MKHRIGTVFHESFSLSRPALSAILRIAVESRKEVGFETIREETHLGNNYVKAMPRYSVGAGLLENKTYRLTPLGHYVYDNDPGLSHPSTQWLMHYHLSAPLGPGAVFWHYLVSRHLRPGARLYPTSLREDVRAFVREAEGKELADRSVRTLITVFTGTYVKTDGLGQLGILQEQGNEFVVQEPNSPSAGVIGYALAHYWEQTWPGLGQVNLNDLYEPGGFASLLLLNAFTLGSRLRELQSKRFLELHQIAPPHQLVRLWNSPVDFLPLLYEGG